MSEAKIVKNKQSLHVTVSPYIRKKIDCLVSEKIFSSPTELTTTALTEFLVRLEVSKEEISAFELLMKIIQLPEGKQAFDKISFDPGIQQDDTEAIKHSKLSKTFSKKVEIE